MSFAIVSGAGYVVSAEVKSFGNRDKLTVKGRFPNGRRNEKPYSDFLDVVIWGSNGDFKGLSEKLVKGQGFNVMGGKLKDNRQEKDDHIYQNEFIELDQVSQFELFGGAPTAETARTSGEGKSDSEEEGKDGNSGEQAGSQPAPDYDSFDDDIPF